MQGIPFDCRRHMESTLTAQIENAVWNKQWSNSTLDHDRVNSTLYYLNWQSLMPAHQKPFTGRNLFALLFMGIFGRHLCSIPGDEDAVPAGLRLSETAALKVSNSLSRNETKLFLDFCRTFQRFYDEEKTRCEAGDAEVASSEAPPALRNTEPAGRADVDMVDGTGKEENADEVMEELSNAEDDSSDLSDLSDEESDGGQSSPSSEDTRGTDDDDDTDVSV